VFERFTHRARLVVVLAQEEARILNHDHLGTEHLLLGLIHEGDGLAATALDSLGISLEAVRRRVEELGGRGATMPESHIPFTPRAKKVLELSMREALALGQDHIGTEHILLGLVREGHGVGAEVLTGFGVDLRHARQTVEAALSVGEAGQILAVDLGGTHTRVALLSPAGEILAHDTESTARNDIYPDQLVAQVERIVGDGDVLRAVVGVPGRVDHSRGRLEFAPNLPAHWHEHLTETWLSAATGLQVALANDADLAAVGEHRFGAGRGVDDMVYVTISTGVGGGAIVGGRLVRGRRSMLEIGHTTIDRHDAGPGRTLEGAASGTALNRLAEAAGLDARGRAVIDLVEAGDPTALAVWDDVVSAAGLGIAGLAHLFSPQMIVIGGGLGLTSDLLYEPLRVAVAAFGPQDMPEPIRIEAASLGDDAGLIGAAGWHAAVGTG
jgi:predicted NBD/HSP70 family sugar kinase